MENEYRSELHKYAKVDSYKNGSVKVSFKNISAHHQANIFRKLGDLGYRRLSNKKFYIEDIGKEKTIGVIQLYIAFEKYLEKVDLSYFNGKITNNDVVNAFFNANPIKQNDLTIYLNTE
jgi:hypothetical protein